MTAAAHPIQPDVGGVAPGVDLSLWLVDLDGPQPGDAMPLPEAVLQRAARFVREGDRRRYLASQRALRALVPHGASHAGAHGKPALAGGPHFNLSRREAWAAVARSRTHPVGVDLETLRPIDDAADLAEMHFSPDERAAVRSAEGAERDRAFLRVWTRKEACMKATGLGLSLAPSSFECGAGPEPRQLEVRSGSAGWTLLVHTPSSGTAPVVVSWAVVLS